VKILVPLDGSKDAEGALPTAVQLARLPGTHTVLACVVPKVEAGTPESHWGSSPVSVDDWASDGLTKPGRSVMTAALETKVRMEERLEAQVRDYLETIRATHFSNLTDIGIETDDDVARSLVQIAKEEHPDVIVMATHGRAGIARWIDGSVTDKVLRSRVAPVLIVKEDA